jgi:hypothetical protein
MCPHVSSTNGRWQVPAGAVGGWGVRRAVNGAIQAIWSCGNCGYRTTPVPHRFLEQLGLDIREMPIIVDYAGTFARCLVRGCEAGDVELNHFAPQAIFGDDANDWPTGWLCVRHQEWGQRVTPQISHRRAS